MNLCRSPLLYISLLAHQRTLHKKKEKEKRKKERERNDTSDTMKTIKKANYKTAVI